LEQGVQARTCELSQANQLLNDQLEENQLLQEQLKEQALRDALTGLYNRYYLQDIFEREIARAQRGSYPVAVLMCDIDWFKRTNDTYGHRAGDVVLVAVGDLLSNLIRHGDVICRYGGEEFIIIMPNISRAEAEQRANDLRAAVEQLSIALHDQRQVNVTVSIGLAVYPEHGDTDETILSHADIALFNAKHLGRNRVVTFQKGMTI